MYVYIVSVYPRVNGHRNAENNYNEGAIAQKATMTQSKRKIEIQNSKCIDSEEKRLLMQRKKSRKMTYLFKRGPLQHKKLSTELIIFY